MLITPVNRRPLSRTTAFAVAIAALVITVPLAPPPRCRPPPESTGSVADPQSGLLPDVVMVLTNTATHERSEIRSDRSGRFEFASLDAGDYLLEARLPSFDAFTSKLTVVNGTVQQDLKLDIGVVQDGTLRASAVRASSTVCAGATGRRDVPAARRNRAETRRAAMHHRAGAARRRSSAATSACQCNSRTSSRIPESMRTAGKSGALMLNARISKDGLLDDISPLSSPGPRVHRRGHPGGQA